MTVDTGHTEHRTSAVLALAARADGHSSAVPCPIGAVSMVSDANAPTGMWRAVDTLVDELTATIRAAIAWFRTLDVDGAAKGNGGPP